MQVRLLVPCVGGVGGLTLELFPSPRRRRFSMEYRNAILTATICRAAFDNAKMPLRLQEFTGSCLTGVY